MIYLEYLLTAAIVVFLSIKASNYIDLLDKNTRISGAFLGGIMLSAVTSLPELFTSISATMLLDRPGLCMGNILGSDLFNLAALSLAILFWFRGFSKGRISTSYRNVSFFVVLIYVFIALNFMEILDLRILNLSITSVLIAAVYALGAKYLAVANDVESDEAALDYHASSSTSLTVRQIIFRFILTGLGIIVFSVLVTYLTDEISVRLNIGQGFAGALFLGVATSLPEVTSTITLFKMKNYNIAVGNIIGSNLFNFIILCVADLLSMGSGVYASPDAQIVNLMFFGGVATALFWFMLKMRSKTSQAVCSAGMIGCYVAFLLI
ncbi:MAG: sodium:calcium antiporter [Emergencia sp.]